MPSKSSPMKGATFFFAILMPVLAFSQKREKVSRDVYNGISGIVLVDSITSEHLRERFSFGDGHVAYITQIDSNSTFKMIESGCLVGSDIVLDHGTWTIKNENNLVLKSKKKRISMDLLKIGKFLFLVNAEKRLEFIGDYRKELAIVSNYKIEPNDERYTREFFIGFHLLTKYAGTEIFP
jgi:hypothetical protein